MLNEYGSRDAADIADFKDEHSRRHRHSALGYRTPAEYAAACNCPHSPMACGIT